MVEIIKEIPETNVFPPINVTRDDNDNFPKLPPDWCQPQKLQAPLSHILEVVLGYDTNHIIHKILLENSITNLTDFMLLDQDTIKLL